MGGPKAMNSFVLLYMLCNLFLCAVWIFEVMLPIMIHGWGVGAQKWSKRIELLVVLYFLVDAVITIFAYDKLSSDKTWVLIDLIITTLLFLYMTIETIILLQYSRRTNSGNCNDGTDISLRGFRKDHDFFVEEQEESEVL